MSEIIEKALPTGVVQSVGTGTSGEIGVNAAVTNGLTPVISNNSGGSLLPTQSRQFIDYIFDQMVLAKDGRRVVMQANTMEIDKVQVGTRMVRKANQAGFGTVNSGGGGSATPTSYTGYGANLGGAQFTKVEVTTTKFRLDYELSTEALEDNIEGAGLEDHIARLMAVQFGNDLEDIAINGIAGDVAATASQTIYDTDRASYPYTLAGFISLVSAAAAGDNYFAAGNVVSSATYGFTSTGLASGTGSAITSVEALYNALPRKFQARRNELKIYASTANVQKLLTDLRRVGYTGGTAGTSTEPIATEVLNGARPRTGGPAGAQYQLFGIPILEVPLMPDSYMDLTFPTNRIWGFQRDITVHREFKPKKDTVEYTVYVRMGVNIEEASAFSYFKS
jgi:hypothetical protein